MLIHFIVLIKHSFSAALDDHTRFFNSFNVHKYLSVQVIFFRILPAHFIHLLRITVPALILYMPVILYGRFHR